MKKALLLTLFALLFTSLRAQDLIIKNNGDEIKSKVVEISDNEIKYRLFDNLDGPLYVMKKAEIFMIRYQNGSKDVFTNNQQEHPNNQQNYNNYNQQNYNQQNYNQQNYNQQNYNQQNYNQRNYNQQNYSNNNYNSQQNNNAYNDPNYLTYTNWDQVSMNGRSLTKTELENLFKNSCPTALELLNTGYAKRASGAALLGVGIACWAVSIPLYLWADDLFILAPILDATGTVFVITSIGLKCAGKARIKNSYKEYNNQLTRKNNPVSLNFGVSSTGGLGLSLKF